MFNFTHYLRFQAVLEAIVKAMKKRRVAFDFELRPFEHEGRCRGLELLLLERCDPGPGVGRYASALVMLLTATNSLRVEAGRKDHDVSTPEEIAEVIVTFFDDMVHRKYEGEPL